MVSRARSIRRFGPRWPGTSAGRRRLREWGLAAGLTCVIHRDPLEYEQSGARPATSHLLKMAADPPTDIRLTDTQARVLAALCRPVSEADGVAAPATDQEIAAAVFLSLDAVRGHLRTLYRKFGIDELPQKRARLVELAIAGGYVEAPSGQVTIIRPEEPADAAPPVPRTLAEEEGKGEGRSLWPYVSIAILVLVIIGASLVTSGIFNQGSNAQKPPTPAEYRQEVAGDCREAMEGGPAAGGGDRAARARGYLEVIANMRGRLESLVPPTVPDIALERFSTGLTNAANLTLDVARDPPAPGSAAATETAAELDAAAAQVNAGAKGYQLGPECAAIGNVVASSARNAEGP